MSNIDKRALRESAERAGQNDWEYVYTSDLSAPGRGYITVGGAEAIYCLNKAAGGVKQSENVLRYIAAASPETMLALLDELDRANKEIDKANSLVDELREERNFLQNLAGKRQIDLEAAEKRIAEQRGIILSARNFISEYAERGDVGAEEFVSIIDRAAGTAKGE